MSSFLRLFRHSAFAKSPTGSHGSSPSRFKLAILSGSALGWLGGSTPLWAASPDPGVSYTFEAGPVLPGGSQVALAADPVPCRSARKYGFAYVYAKTTPGLEITDRDEGLLFENGVQSPARVAHAASPGIGTAVGDLSEGQIEVSATCNPRNNRLVCRVDKPIYLVRLIHELGHKGRVVFRYDDPMVFPEWPPNAKLAFGWTLTGASFLPCTVSVVPEVSRAQSRVVGRTSLPGLS